MTRPEIEAALAIARDRLADVEETFEFTCAHTNAHLADAMIEEFAVELEECREEVRKLEEMLKGLG